MKELAAHSGSPHDWWTIDLCFWPNAWPATRKCKKAVDALNALVAGKSKVKKSSAPAPKTRTKPARPKRAAKKNGGRGKRR